MSVKVNMQYKDRLFRLLFGEEESKANILSLYNALNNSSYTNPDDLVLTTIEDVIYIKMKNDTSFLIESYLNLWEQQSSYNPNMPLRGLLYFGKLYSAYIEDNELNIYGSKQIKIPTPRYIVFYNGIKKTEPITKLKLSDAFLNPDASGEFEWTATMYDLNEGMNDSLLEKCKPLHDYMLLIYYIRENQKKGLGIEDAVDEAVKRCMKENVMSDFLGKHRAEVLEVCITEFNEQTFVKGIKAEGFEEGLSIGREEGLSIGREEGLSIGREEGLSIGRNMLLSLVIDGLISLSEGAKRLGVSVEEMKKLMERYELELKM